MKQSDLLNQLYTCSKSATKKEFSEAVNYNYTNIAKRFNNINAMRLDDLISWCNVFSCNLLFSDEVIRDQTELINTLIKLSGSENLNQLSIKLNATYKELHLFYNNKRKLSVVKFLSWAELLNLQTEIIKPN